MWVLLLTDTMVNVYTVVADTLSNVIIVLTGSVLNMTTTVHW